MIPLILFPTPYAAIADEPKTYTFFDISTNPNCIALLPNAVGRPTEMIFLILFHFGLIYLKSKDIELFLFNKYLSAIIAHGILAPRVAIAAPPIPI